MKAKTVANRGSDTKEGDGWWMASDRKWYPPELHPDNRAKAKAAAASAAPSTSTSGSSASPGATSEAAAGVQGSAATTTTTGASNPAATADGAAAAVAASASATSSASAPAASSGAVAAPPIRQATPVAPTVPNAPVRPGPAAPTTGTPTVGAPTAAPRTQTNFQTPTAAPTRAPAYAASGATGETPVVDEDDSSPNLVAGIWAAVSALLALLGCFLTWANNNGATVAGVDPVDVSFSGMDSNARPALVFAVIMLVGGLLLYLGKRPGLLFGLVVIACGAGIMGMVFYAYVDITGRASTSWAAEVARDAELPLSSMLDAGVGLKPAFGLWVTALGGFLGAMTGPFLRRDAEREVDVGV